LEILNRYAFIFFQALEIFCNVKRQISVFEMRTGTLLFPITAVVYLVNNFPEILTFKMFDQNLNE